MILDNSPVRSPLKGVDEGIRYNDIALAGYAGLQTLGFMSKEQIANYQAEVPLDRSPIDELLLIAGTSCHGEPMRYKVSGTNKELELYAFVRALIVVPYWLDYQDGSPEAQGFWQKHVNYLLRHEMMHLYDFVDIVNEAVFRMKGEIDLKNEMIAKRARPYEAARMGAFNYSQYEFKTYFGTHIDNLKKGIGVANNYFHHAIYAADLEGKKTDHFDIDMKTRAPKLPSWGETQHTYRVAEACLAVPVLQAVGFPDEYEKMKQICAQGG
jgi:hypothetical protein